MLPYLICIIMKTCNYCGRGCESMRLCECGEWLNHRETKRKLKQVKHYWRHTFRRLRKGILKNARSKNKFAFESHDVTAMSLWGLAKRQKCICPLSGRKITNENISVDHIVPLSKGGTHDITNLRLTVKETNYARLNMSDDEFISLCKDVVKYNS